MKKTVYIILLTNFFILANGLTVYALDANKQVHKLKIQQVESKGILIQALPETILDTELSLEGDFFSAFLSNNSSRILRVPEGSRLIGKIIELRRPKSFGIGANLKVHINELMLPDGSNVKVSADFSSKASMQSDEKPNAVKSLARKVAKDTSNVTASALVGAVDTLQYGGLGAAIATSGISTLAGAGLGLGLGLIGVFTTKGEELINAGFEPVNLKLDSDFVFLQDLPVMAQKLEPVSASLLGVDIKVNKVSKQSSRDFGEFLLMNIELTNNSLKDLFMGDFVLSSSRHIIPIMNNPLLMNSGLITIAKKKSHDVSLAFSLGSIKKEGTYQLMMLNPITQEIVANIDIDISAYL